MDDNEKQKIWKLMKERKFHRIVVEFSGGNDEGGTDSVIAFGPGRNKTNLEDSSKYNWETHQSEGGDELYEKVTAPVDDEYGSFAGDFYVNGTITYELRKKKVLYSGNEEVRHDEPFSREL